jgi:hypothetical protein
MVVPLRKQITISPDVIYKANAPGDERPVLSVGKLSALRMSKAAI